jgi:hypothetical protein
MTGRRTNLEPPESISEVERVSATTMADLKAIAEPINQNAHRLTELDQTACERTAKVDSSEKMDSISGQRPETLRRWGGGERERWVVGAVEVEGLGGCWGGGCRRSGGGWRSCGLRLGLKLGGWPDVVRVQRQALALPPLHPGIPVVLDFVVCSSR